MGHVQSDFATTSLSSGHLATGGPKSKLMAVSSTPSDEKVEKLRSEVVSCNLA